MDRIQVALERSKGKWDGGAEALKSGSKKRTAERIIYTRTRSVEVPVAHLREERIIVPAEDGPCAEAYKLLRTQVMHRMRENNWSVLGVTSPREKAGKTVTALNLAIRLAMEVDQSVLLVDADLRNPRLHHLLALEEGQGLGEHLLEDLPIESLLVHPGMGRLVVLPGGRRLYNSAEWLSSPKMIELVNELRHRYAGRIVLFDLPPILDSADVLGFSPFLDAILLVVEAGRTKVEEIERVRHLLQGVPLIGTVLNKG